MRPNIRDIKHITSDTVLKSCDFWAFVNDRVITVIPSDMLTVVGEPGFVCLRTTEEHGAVRIQSYSLVPGKSATHAVIERKKEFNQKCGRT